MTSDRSYYDQILKITQDYLGPAADRFLNRQINTHLKKSATALVKSDIEILALRIRSGLAVITGDETVVDEAFRRLNAVAE